MIYSVRAFYDAKIEAENKDDAEAAMFIVMCDTRADEMDYLAVEDPLGDVDYIAEELI